jgi:hypothetical protein
MWDTLNSTIVGVPSIAEAVNRICQGRLCDFDYRSSCGLMRVSESLKKISARVSEGCLVLTIKGSPTDAERAKNVRFLSQEIAITPVFVFAHMGSCCPRADFYVANSAKVLVHEPEVVLFGSIRAYYS